MTKKCGIVTITVGSNYGNRLQNYAMQTIVKQMGYLPETIQYKSSYELEPKKIELSKIEKIKSYKLAFKLLVGFFNAGRGELLSPRTIFFDI